MAKQCNWYFQKLLNIHKCLPWTSTLVSVKSSSADSSRFDLASLVIGAMASIDWASLAMLGLPCAILCGSGAACIMLKKTRKLIQMICWLQLNPKNTFVLILIHIEFNIRWNMGIISYHPVCHLLSDVVQTFLVQDPIYLSGDYDAASRDGQDLRKMVGSIFLQQWPPGLD